MRGELGTRQRYVRMIPRQRLYRNSRFLYYFLFRCARGECSVHEKNVLNINYTITLHNLL